MKISNRWQQIVFRAAAKRECFLVLGRTPLDDIRLSIVAQVTDCRIDHGYTNNLLQGACDVASLLGRVTVNRAMVIINRCNREDVVLVAAELSSLLETAHLLRSPTNAERLLTALNRARSKKLKHQSIEQLRQKMGLDPKG